MLNREFLLEFKRATEAKWRDKSVKPDIYGFQFQRGTRWNPGLSDAMISEYEGWASARFPTDLTTFLREMNGTDLATVNVYGLCGEPYRKSVGVYSYPRDLDILKRRTEDARARRAEITSDLAEQGFELPVEAILVPFFEHRYVVCTPDLSRSAVLSIANDVVGGDSIVYGNSLQEYLEKEFLEGAP